jgi:hypothetical protein
MLTTVTLFQVQKLKNAMREYENDRWRIIATKVGSGFSPAVCKEKAEEITALETSSTERDRGPESTEEPHFEQPAAPESTASTEAPPPYH